MIQTAAPSARRPPQKKRHTKPCRYYQIGTCPHTAQEDCDFAHVYSDQPVTLPPQKQCRYYAQGNCTNGIWCQYKHGDENAEMALLEEYRNIHLLGAHRRGDLGLVNLTPGSPPPLQVQMRAAPPAVYVPHAGTPWSPYADSCYAPLAADFVSSSPVAPGAVHVYPVPFPVVSPTPSIDSSSTESSSPTSSSSVSEDQDHLDAAATQREHEHPHLLHSPNATSYFGASAYAVPYVEPSYPSLGGGAAYGMVPLHEAFSRKLQPPPGLYISDTDGGLPQSPVSLLQNPLNRQKLASYRTKPCRYFKPGSVCPKGDECTFIHAEPKPEAEPEKLQHELPARPLSQKEDNTRKGFFPISWRVIGGGVRLSGGGVKDPDFLMSDESLDIGELSVTAPAALELAIPVSSGIAFPSSESEPMEGDTYNSVTPTGTSTGSGRQRASSIPSTPITTHADVLRLFQSAESPGGL